MMNVRKRRADVCVTNIPDLNMGHSTDRIHSWRILSSLIFILWKRWKGVGRTLSLSLLFLAFLWKIWTNERPNDKKKHQTTTMQTCKLAHQIQNAIQLGAVHEVSCLLRVRDMIESVTMVAFPPNPSTAGCTGITTNVRPPTFFASIKPEMIFEMWVSF